MLGKLSGNVCVGDRMTTSWEEEEEEEEEYGGKRNEGNESGA